MKDYLAESVEKIDAAMHVLARAREDMAIRRYILDAVDDPELLAQTEGIERHLATEADRFDDQIEVDKLVAHARDRYF